jgi:hypothetical protein
VLPATLEVHAEPHRLAFTPAPFVAAADRALIGEEHLEDGACVDPPSTEEVAALALLRPEQKRASVAGDACYFRT